MIHDYPSNVLERQTYMPWVGPTSREDCLTLPSEFARAVELTVIKIILVRHTSYNVDDLKAPSSAINK
jgi:hypothetical protein